MLEFRFEKLKHRYNYHIKLIYYTYTMKILLRGIIRKYMHEVWIKLRETNSV
jgi:hypothetical protein